MSFLILASALRLWPKPPLREQIPLSTAIYAQDGSLLRLTLAQDQQYRVWTPLAEISPRLVQGVKLYEDRWFDWHFGVNPYALARSAVSTYWHEDRQGGSTLTMQLARRLYRINSRSVSGKLQQMVAAVWLELRYSKRDILEAYLNLAPYGGNIEGVGAASLIYFHKPPQRLALPEILTLAVIPQNPRKRAALGSTDLRNGQHEGLPPLLEQARQRLWQQWLKQHPQDQRFAADMALPLKAYSPAQLPFRAPHFTDMLLRRVVEGQAPDNRILHTGIQLSLQQTLERMLQQYVENHRNIGISNASAMLVDVQTMQVKALVGSADYFNQTINGQVNGTLAKRSPGSALKPFIYALAIDQGILHPRTILKDTPTAFGPFNPENFDGRFVGPISAQDALVRSRNIPAVAVSAKLSRPNLYDFLKSAGVSNLASEKHYGLALALGGGEITMEELAKMYALLANQGVLQPLSYFSGGRPQPLVSAENKQAELRLLSHEASFMTLDILRHNPRPDTGLPAVPAVAWKTGTSWGFRDAWTAGMFGRYVLVVWIGNFDGSNNPAFVGIKAAAPLFFQIVDSLRAQHLDGGELIEAPPINLSKVEVCAASGDLPNEYCRERINTWFIPGKSPIRVSTLHRAIWLDRRDGHALCSEQAANNPNAYQEIFEYWPTDLARLFRDAGMPRRVPPVLPHCASSPAMQESEAPQITSPVRGAVYSMRVNKPVAIALRANQGGNHARLYWFINQSFIGSSKPGEALAWNPPQAGRFQLRAIDENGLADHREVLVEFEQ